MQHELKCWPEHFRDVVQPNRNKRKMVEIRKGDRPYKVGDILRLKEYNPETEQFTNAWQMC